MTDYGVPRKISCQHCGMDNWRHRFRNGRYQGWDCITCGKKYLNRRSRGVPCPDCGTDEWAYRTDRRPGHTPRWLCRHCTALQVANRPKRDPKEYYRTHRMEMAEYRREYRKTHPEVSLVLQARRRCRASSVPCTLQPSDIVIPSHCPILGIPLKRNLGGHGPKDDSPSLDRTNPKLGYVPGNVVVVSHRANRIKNDGTAEEHELVAKWIRSQNP